MQLYALATANPFAGALAMLLYSLGTVPLMFGLGALASALGKRFTQKVMTVGSVLVVVLGLAMFSQGWTLSGLALPELPGAGAGAQQTPGADGQAGSGAGVDASASAGAQQTPGADGQAGTGSQGGTDAQQQTGAEGQAQLVDGIQQVNSTLASGRYPDITVAVGVPVRWAIDAPQGSINGCNNRMILREYDVEHTFKTGENIIEFVPEKTGKFQYSCWMGMIRATVTVV
jgi:hypothetical protein